MSDQDQQKGKDGRSSIFDVADRAGVSTATVSRTFQYPSRVKEKTREAVLAAAKDLNYMPNAQARTLRTARTRLIVALVPDVTNPFFSEVIRGLEEVAKDNGYSVLLGDTQSRPENEQRYGDMVSSRQVDGMVSLVNRIPEIRLEGRLPVVNACEPIEDPAIASVTIDNAAAFREGVAYLIALGHRRIAYIGGPSRTSRDREKGFVAAMKAAGLEADVQLIQSRDISIEGGIRAADMALSYPTPITAFACVSDQLAIGVMHALRDRNLSVPTDVSVIGFDDISFARYTYPPLTTVAQPCAQMGREAMHMLLEILDNRSAPPRAVQLPTQLVVRGSAAAPHPGRV